MISPFTLRFAPLVLLVSCCLATAWAQPVPQAGGPRIRRSIDFDWLFELGDTADAKQPKYDDSKWRELNLPHDWSIEGTYDKDHPAGRSGGYLPTGVGWYRKHLTWDDSWAGQRVLLQFDGVYMNSDVWVNGQHVGRRPYGYVSFWYDITDCLDSGDNIIAVRVDNSGGRTGRWYTGSGIYRHVWLTTVDPIHVPTWGTQIVAEQVSPEKALLRVATEVVNENDESREISLETLVVDGQGSQVATALERVEVESGAENTVTCELNVNNPRLWTPETPQLYTLRSIVRQGDEIVDAVDTRTGIREVCATVDRGFLLNGKEIELQGVCMHHDAGPVGAAVPADVLRRRLLLLKEMGANAIRTSHNPFAPEFYEMADEIGLMVMDEAFDGWRKPKVPADYGLYFDDWWRRDLEDFVRRDRNHPSVVIWSIGNEVPGWTNDDQKQLVDFVHALDPTRPITQGRGYRGPHIDVAGFNGHGEYRGAIERFHKNNPNRPIVGTEITHSSQTRGVYRTKTSYRTRDNPAPWEQGGKGHLAKWRKLEPKVNKIPDLTEQEIFADVHPRYHSSYDNAFVRMCVRDELRMAKQLPYFIGTFRWTGFDYLGESFGWPARTDNFGVIDLAGFPKDHFYLYQSQWSSTPMVHLLPHWTHPGKEDVEIPVVVYTNQESAELFLNGQSLGEQPMTDEMQIVWMVPYKQGELRVVAKSNGQPVTDKSVRTAGHAADVYLECDRETMSANQTDVAHVEVTVVDESGEPVPAADNLIGFSVQGPGQLIGVENGDILDLSSSKVNYRKAFMGKCLLLIQATQDAGEVLVTATSPGLRPQSVAIQSVSVNDAR